MKRHTAATERGHSRFRFFSSIISELKKVVWLSKKEAMYLTFLVLVVSITVGLILGAFDYGFARLVDVVFLGR